MMAETTHLLKRLEPPVRPAAAPPPTNAPRGPVEGQSFEQLLTLVSDGSVSSGREVSVGFESETPLTTEQLERLAVAADRSEAAGARRALTLIDGRAFVLEVPERRLTTELQGGGEMQVLRIDAAVYVPDESADDSGGLRLPATGVLPPGVARALEQAIGKTDTRQHQAGE